MSRKLEDFIKANNEIFIFPWQNSTYQNEYLENSDIINIVMRNKYGSLPLKLENDNETLSLIQGVLLINRYKIDTLWNTTNLEYNPIWNVDGTETTTTEYGEHITDRDYGERKLKSDYGQQKTTSEFGNRENTSKDFVFPYDDNENKNQTTEHTDFQNAENDIVTSDAFTNESLENARKDSEKSFTHTDKVTIERKGNIGVTSTQELITRERQVANFEFWNVIIEMICKEITIPYYESEVQENACCYWCY